jgi:hypothetical protein
MQESQSDIAKLSSEKTKVLETFANKIGESNLALIKIIADVPLLSDDDNRLSNEFITELKQLNEINPELAKSHMESRKDILADRQKVRDSCLKAIELLNQQINGMREFASEVLDGDKEIYIKCIDTYAAMVKSTQATVDTIVNNNASMVKLLIEKSCDGLTAWLSKDTSNKSDAASKNPSLLTAPQASSPINSDGASKLYGMFKAQYRDPEARNSPETAGIQQQAKDAYKAMLQGNLSTVEKATADKRLKKLKDPEANFAAKKA